MEFIGILHRIGDIENLSGSSNFAKRPFFLKYIDSKNKEQLVKFVFYEPQLDIINNFQISEKVKIEFDFRGFDSPKTGKYFEEKVATSIKQFDDPDNKNKPNKTKLPETGQIRPDFTRSYEEFPDQLVY